MKIRSTLQNVGGLGHYIKVLPCCENKMPARQTKEN